MRSPVYDRDLDIVAVSADDRIGAFCIVWMDAVNRVGLFEPVGTHPDFQRKGLGEQPSCWRDCEEFKKAV